MEFGLCFDYDCLDLPSLTNIQCGNDNWAIHYHMGYVVLESMI